MRGLDVRMSVTGQIAIAEVITEDHYKIGSSILGLFCREQSRPHKCHQQAEETVHGPSMRQAVQKARSVATAAAESVHRTIRPEALQKLPARIDLAAACRLPQFARNRHARH